MKRKGKKRFLYLLICFFSIMILTSPFIILHYYFPQKIRLLEGREHLFEFSLPLQANITPEKIGVLKINNKPIEESNIKLKLNKPFTMQVDHEGAMNVKLSLLGLIPVRSMQVDVLPYRQVVPGGNTIGVRIATDGVMVLGIGTVKGTDDKNYEPGRGALETGDLILEVNNQKLDSKEDLITCISNSNNDLLAMKILRNESIIYHSVKPIYSKEEQTYKIGVWVRDSTQGIGTITYYNPETNMYGALGHGIADVDTKQMMTVKEGNLIKTEVTSIRKGKKGSPGELSGIILENNKSVIGDISYNTEQGIYGNLNTLGMDILQYEPVLIAFQDEVKEGEAIILSNISGEKVEAFKVHIQKISRYNNDTSKGMIVKIVDERLLDTTNGIVQGMSGSPILQNNKLIGAITHVFVQDPTKGYGIFIENMLQKEKEVK